MNSNMRRHYRTHFTPGTVDLSELSYSAADEKFYRHAATNPASSTASRARFGPTSHYLPPTPSISYGTIPHYPRSNSPPAAPSRGRDYAVVPVSYIPVIYHHRPNPPTDPAHFSRHREYEYEHREVDQSVGRLKPASDWNRGRVPDDAEDKESESDYDEDCDEVDQDADR